MLYFTTQIMPTTSLVNPCLGFSNLPTALQGGFRVDRWNKPPIKRALETDQNASQLHWNWLDCFSFFWIRFCWEKFTYYSLNDLYKSTFTIISVAITKLLTKLLWKKNPWPQASISRFEEHDNSKHQTIHVIVKLGRHNKAWKIALKNISSRTAITNLAVKNLKSTFSFIKYPDNQIEISYFVIGIHLCFSTSFLANTMTEVYKFCPKNMI